LLLLLQAVLLVLLLLPTNFFVFLPALPTHLHWDWALSGGLRSVIINFIVLQIV
jgi:hypothetical protein